MPKRRSFVDAFLQTEAREQTASKQATRLELVRMKNRRDKLYQNMLKTKERTKEMIAKLRELETAHAAAEEEVRRLKAVLAEVEATDTDDASQSDDEEGGRLPKRSRCDGGGATDTDAAPLTDEDGLPLEEGEHPETDFPRGSRLHREDK